MKITGKLILAFFSFVFLFSACTPDDMPTNENEEPEEEAKESFTWTYMGEEKSAVSITGESWTSAGGRDYETRRLYISGQDAQGERFKVTMINALDLGAGECPKEMTYPIDPASQSCGESDGGYSYCQEGHLSLRLQSGDVYGDEDKAGQVILNSCLSENNKASGTFKGTVERLLDNGEVVMFEISGSFENVDFVVL